MKKNNKLNNFITKHSSLLTQFEGTPSIHKKLRALKEIINLDNTHQIILSKRKTAKYDEKQVMTETCEKAVKALNRMYEGLESYEFEKIVENDDRYSRRSKTSNRQTVRSFQTSRKNSIQKQKQESVIIAEKCKQFRRIKVGGHKDPYTANICKNMCELKKSWAPKATLNHHTKMKNEIDKLKARAYQRYGIKFAPNQNKNHSAYSILKKIKRIDKQSDFEEFEEQNKTSKSKPKTVSLHKRNHHLSRNVYEKKTQSAYEQAHVPQCLIRNGYGHHELPLQIKQQPKKSRIVKKYFRI